MTTKITEKNISNISNAAVQWQSVITADGSTNTTAVAGEGYFIDTTSAAHTIVLPTSPNVGDTLQIRDYASSFGTNNVTLDVGSLKLGGVAANGTIDTNDTMATLVYSGTDKGWLSVENEAKVNLVATSFTSATGGTVTTSGNYKIHTFTSSGCFVVSSVGNSPLNPAAGPAVVDYVVVAGGGGGGTSEPGDGGAGGGAGGYRESHSTCNSGPYTASPLATPTGITVTATTYPITVGSGGSGMQGTRGTQAANGSNSVFSTITSAGGGGAGKTNTPLSAGENGGSGGGGAGGGPGIKGNGNTPPVSPPQGANGGNSLTVDYGPTGNWFGGGGGGATENGAGGNPAGGGNGGNGATSSITGSPVTRAGGGGADNAPARSPSGTRGTGGSGGGGPSSGSVGTSSGTANTGGGGGAVGHFSHPDTGAAGGNGGSGVVIIRYQYQ